MKYQKPGHQGNAENKIKHQTGKVQGKVQGKSRKTNRISKKEVPKNPCITVRM